jgi:phosphate transport system substrate-binding protein
MLSLITFALMFSAHAADKISIDGSSTVFPITEAVAEEFQNAKKGAVRVTVGISGTGGGFKKFCRGETDIQDASRPIQKAAKPGESGEMETCKAAGIKYFEVPVGFDAMAIVVNNSNTFLKQVTVAELKKMWEPAAQGKVMKWKDVNPAWPDLPLKLYGAGADSGTFDYFTEAVVGKAKSSRGDYTASEDDNVLVKGVSSDKGALGFIPFAYYEPNKSSLKIVPVVSPAKKAVIPSRETVENGSYAPLSRPIFIYVNEKSYQRPEVKEFVEFYLTNASKLVAEVKYVPLPAEAYKLGLEHVKVGKLGTAFGGHSEVGMKINDLMKKEKRL